jgi:DNA-binding NarL/FixJ family response regulator
LDGLDRQLSEYQEKIAIGATNGLTSAEIGAQFGPGMSAPKTIERRLGEMMDRFRALNRPQLARHLFGLGIAVPDEEMPSLVPDLTPTETVVLGLVSHGLAGQQIVEATRRLLSGGAVKRALMSASDGLGATIPGTRRDDVRTVTAAFERGLFSLTYPDLVMSPEFLVPGMQRLLDPEHDFAIPS